MIFTDFFNKIEVSILIKENNSGENLHIYIDIQSPNKNLHLAQIKDNERLHESTEKLYSSQDQRYIFKLLKVLLM